jgi:hypothetical protein
MASNYRYTSYLSRLRKPPSPAARNDKLFVGTPRSGIQASNSPFKFKGNNAYTRDKLPLYINKTPALYQPEYVSSGLY